MKLCEECEKEIPAARLKLVPETTFCVKCQSKDDVFKFKMKTINRDDEPTIARDKKTWDKIKKQKKLSNI